jgi:hypothetical protein
VCSSPALLSPDFEWGFREPWDPCATCGSLQYTDVHCYYSDDVHTDGARSPVNDSACPPAIKPSNTRSCQNVTLGCVYNTDPGDKNVQFFGQTIAKNTLMFGILGAVALVAVILACCYQGITYGHEGKEDDITPEHSLNEYQRKVTKGGRKASEY